MKKEKESAQKEIFNSIPSEDELLSEAKPFLQTLDELADISGEIRRLYDKKIYWRVVPASIAGGFLTDFYTTFPQNLAAGFNFPFLSGIISFSSYTFGMLFFGFAAWQITGAQKLQGIMNEIRKPAVQLSEGVKAGRWSCKSPELMKAEAEIVHLSKKYAGYAPPTPKP